MSKSDSNFEIRSGGYVFSYDQKTKPGFVVISKVDGDKSKGVISDFGLNLNKGLLLVGGGVSVEERVDVVSAIVSLRNNWGDFGLKFNFYKDKPGLVNWSLETEILKAAEHIRETTGGEMKFYDIAESKVIATNVINYFGGTPGTWSAAGKDDRYGGTAFFHDPKVLGCTVLYHQDFSELTDYYKKLYGPKTEDQKLRFWKAFWGKGEKTADLQEFDERWPSFSVGPRAESTWNRRSSESEFVKIKNFGYKLPRGDKKIEAGKKFVLLNSFLYLTDNKPKSSSEYAKLYLKLFSDVYDLKKKPETIYVEWKDDIVPELIEDLKSKENWGVRNGVDFISAYATLGHDCGELNTTTAVLVPLDKYYKKYGKGENLHKALKKGLRYFYDENWQNVNGHQGLVGNGLAPYGKDYHIESWYYMYPLTQMGEFARRGYDDAKEMFLAAMPTTIDMARKLGYLFPKIVNVRTGERVVTDHVASNGYMYDCTGGYVYLMMLAYELSGDAKYVEEARRAADKMIEVDMGFELPYEMHVVGVGPIGLLKLYKQTSEKKYLELSYVSFAVIIRHSWLWVCDYGYLADHPTFFLTSATPENVVANGFEEADLWVYVKRYYEEGDDILPDYVKKFAAELLKHKIGGFESSLTPNIPEEAIAPYSFVVMRGGHLVKDSYIPLEGSVLGWRESGDCGQAIYSAGGPIVMANELYYMFADDAIELYSEYPLLESSWEEGKLKFRAGGTSDYTYKIRLKVTSETDLDAKQALVYENGSKVAELDISEGPKIYSAKGATEYVVVFK